MENPISVPTVANLSHEEKISWLVHQHEGLQDWRMTVNERLETGEKNSQLLNAKVDAVTNKLGNLANRMVTLGNKMEERHSQLLLIQQQVLIAVQGQRIPGMEAPGVVDRTKALEDRVAQAEQREAAKDAKVLALEQFKFRAQLFFGGLITLAGFSAWKAIPYITQIAAVFGIGP